jgi:acyl-CoA synthetase (AMP-forming)/AMP-acid ligase II
MVLPTEHAAAITIFGSARLGAIQVSLNTFLRGEFLRYQLANSRSSICAPSSLLVTSRLPIGPASVTSR